MRTFPVVLVAALGACESVPPPAAPPAAEVAPARGVEMIRVDPAARARWHAVHAPGLEGAPASPRTSAVPADEAALRARVHASGAPIALPAGGAR